MPDMEPQHSDTFATIESIEFAVHHSVVSGFNSLIKVLEEDTTFQVLQEIARSQPDLIVKQLADVAIRSFDHRYENPFDVATAAYYWALYSVKLPLQIYTDKAERIIGSMTNLFWARRVVEKTKTSQALMPIQLPIVNVSQQRLGWKYWPTVLFWECLHRIQMWWKSIWKT